jgi:hypothetical protein
MPLWPAACCSGATVNAGLYTSFCLPCSMGTIPDRREGINENVSRQAQPRSCSGSARRSRSRCGAWCLAAGLECFTLGYFGGTYCVPCTACNMLQTTRLYYGMQVCGSLCSDVLAHAASSRRTTCGRTACSPCSARRAPSAASTPRFVDQKRFGPNLTPSTTMALAQISLRQAGAGAAPPAQRMSAVGGTSLSEPRMLTIAQ